MMAFLLIEEHGVELCRDEGHPFLLETVVVSSKLLPVGSPGTVSKVWVTNNVLSGKWDIRPVGDKTESEGGT